MARKKRVSFSDELVQTVSDMANAASVAATGSEIGVLELAAEDKLSVRPAKRSRKVKAALKKKTVAKKSGKPIKKKRTVKRRKR